MAKEPQGFPIIRLEKRPRVADRLQGRSVVPPPGFSRPAQIQRLDAPFQTIRRNLDAVWNPVNVRTGSIGDDPTAIGPDRALVIKVIGSLADFARSATEVGLEYLGEGLEDLVEDEIPKVAAGARQPSGEGHLYVSMLDEAALRSLLRMWDAFKESSKAPRIGAGGWWQLFPMIASLRTWSAADRIETPTLDYINRMLGEAPGQRVVLEIDLWFREGRRVRNARRASFLEQIDEDDATILDEAVIEAIQYHGMLASLSPAAARAVLERQGPIAVAEEVMSVRPQSLAAFDREIDDDDGIPMTRRLGDIDDRDPLIGILDGFPVANHAYLQDRLDVQTVDVQDEDVPVQGRLHGTQMASLVLHGDLQDETQRSLPRRVVSIPVLTLDRNGRETTPPDRLAVKIVERAVKAMLVGLDDDEPSAPSLVVFNHSIGDENQPFRGLPSAWARLLDHLMFEHDILFVTSAGNIRSEFPIEGYRTPQAFHRGEKTGRSTGLLGAIHRSRDSRRMISPAEAINGLTVGALHSDGARRSFVHDPFELAGAASVYSSVGPGLGGGIKPDFLASGGRQLVSARQEGGTLFARGLSSPHLGHLTAVPDTTGLLGDARRRCSGTSNAAALTTRMVGWIAEALDDAVEHEPEDDDWFARPTRAAVLKALVAHGARWGGAGDTLEGLHDDLGSNWQTRRRNVAGLIGYGECDVERVVEGSDRRVTMLAEGLIRDGERHEYDLPLPQGMHGIKEVREIDLTLAWMSPLRPRAANHRAVKLTLNGTTSKETQFWPGVASGGVIQPPPTMTAKGTLRRLRLKGDRIESIAVGETMRVGVQAMAKAGFEDVEVPYALVATIEVGELVTQNIHEQVNEALREQARVRAAGRARVRGRERSR